MADWQKIDFLGNILIGEEVEPFLYEVILRSEKNSVLKNFGIDIAKPVTLFYFFGIIQDHSHDIEKLLKFWGYKEEAGDIGPKLFSVPVSVSGIVLFCVLKRESDQIELDFYSNGSKKEVNRLKDIVEEVFKKNNIDYMSIRFAGMCRC